MPQLSPISWILIIMLTWLLILLAHFTLFHKQPSLSTLSNHINKIKPKTPWS